MESKGASMELVPIGNAGAVAGSEKALGKFDRSNKKLTKELAIRLAESEDQLRIEQQRVDLLERILRENGIEVPARLIADAVRSLKTSVGVSSKANGAYIGILETSDEASIAAHMERVSTLIAMQKIYIRYTNLKLWTTVKETTIDTVGTVFLSLFDCFNSHTQRYDILKDLSGTIAEGKMTLVLGPPASGKSSFMKLLSGRLHMSSALRQEGEILFNSESAEKGNFLVQKVVDYVDQQDIHEPVLTVAETVTFAFKATTGGHHSYGMAKDVAKAALMDSDDANLSKVRE
jgi:ABC-type molybdenum transport system ATPase subunit/photorepair protein PhrA